MIRTNKTSLYFLKKAPLYLRTDEGKFRIYKKSGVTLEEAGLSLQDLPGKLFLAPEDKLTALQEIQAGLNKLLKEHIKSGDLTGVKDTMVELMEETLTEPRSGGLEGIAPMVDTWFMNMPISPKSCAPWPSFPLRTTPRPCTR